MQKICQQSLAKKKTIKIQIQIRTKQNKCITELNDEAVAAAAAVVVVVSSSGAGEEEEEEEEVEGDEEEEEVEEEEEEDEHKELLQNTALHIPLHLCFPTGTACHLVHASLRSSCRLAPKQLCLHHPVAVRRHFSESGGRCRH